VPSVAPRANGGRCNPGTEEGRRKGSTWYGDGVAVKGTARASEEGGEYQEDAFQKCNRAGSSSRAPEEDSGKKPGWPDA
jgi:hypothetical protein